MRRSCMRTIHSKTQQLKSTEKCENYIIGHDTLHIRKKKQHSRVRVFLDFVSRNYFNLLPANIWILKFLFDINYLKSKLQTTWNTFSNTRSKKTLALVLVHTLHTMVKNKKYHPSFRIIVHWTHKKNGLTWLKMV